MQMDLKPAGEPKNGMGHAACAAMQELDKQRLRILRCTAQAMVCSPGGLRFEAGTRPWLEGLSVGPPVASRPVGQRGDAATRPTAT